VTIELSLRFVLSSGLVAALFHPTVTDSGDEQAATVELRECRLGCSLTWNCVTESMAASAACSHGADRHAVAER
jgi:hypothetical protein